MSWLQSSAGRRVVGIVLLTLALLALVFIATTLGVEPRVAYLVALGVFGLAAIAFGLSQLRAAHSASQLEAALRTQGLGAGGTARPGQPDFDDLRKQFDESLALLKQSRLGRGALYKLPWFVVIGPPGSGKTTLLRESGLNFPYMTKGRAAIRGLNGTKNCDWWFADRGVLLDTAGRWTSEADDRDEWLAFLDLMRKYRRKQPVNGVVVAVSLDSVVFSSTAELQKLANDVRDRIDELTRRLQVLLPVYLVFTKCDLLVGFVESFGGMSREQRAQAWGFTFPDKHPPDFRFPDAFALEIDQLGAQLGKRRLPQLVAEPMRRRRRLIFRLPQEFVTARERLCQFAELIQQANPYQEASAIRGCYFTSGTQERGALGDLVTEMARKSGVSVEELEIPSGERKCYFVDDVFNKIVFEDRDLAKPTRTAGRRNRVLHWMQLGGIVACAVLLLWLTGKRFSQVSSLTERIVAIVRQSEDAANTKAQRLAALRDLHTLASAASRRPEVENLLSKHIDRCAARELVTPAAEAIAKAYSEVGATQTTSDSLATRIAKVAEAREGLEQRRKQAGDALTGQRKEFSQAVLQLLRQERLDREDQGATLAMFEALVKRSQAPSTLWEPAITQWTDLRSEFEKQEKRQLQEETSLLEQIEQDKGMMFQANAEEGHPVQLERLSCSTLNAEGLFTTMLSKGNVTIAESEPTPTFEDDAFANADKQKDKILALPIAPSLAAKRESVLIESVTTFRKTVFPTWRERRWSEVFGTLTLAKDIDQPKTLAANEEKLVHDFTRLATLYVARNNLSDSIKKRAHDRLERVTRIFRSLASAGNNLAALTKAIESLGQAAQAAGTSCKDDWSQTVGELETQKFGTIAAGEEKLLKSIVASQASYARAQIKAKYGELATTHNALKASFPFSDDGEDCDAATFFTFLDDLRQVAESCNSLRRLQESWEGRDALGTLSTDADFDDFLKRVERLTQQFDGATHRVNISFYPYHDNLDSIAMTRGAERIFEQESMDSPMVKLAVIQPDNTGQLQIELKTDREVFTLKNLVTNDAWIKQRKDGAAGLPASYWSIFRLCRSGARVQGPAVFAVKGEDKNSIRVELGFRSAISKLNQPLILVISGSGNGEEQLFAPNSDAFDLTFPRFPGP